MSSWEDRKFCLTRQEDINARDGGVRQEKQLKQPHWISFSCTCGNLQLVVLSVGRTQMILM